MTTIATDGKTMYADVRSTNTNPLHYACNDCGSTGFANKQESRKITVLHRVNPDAHRFVDGKVAMMYGCAGSSNLQSFLRGIWTERSDLSHIIAAFSFVNMEKTTIPDGGALIVTEDNSVYRFSISPKKKLFALAKIKEKDLPVSIGSGSPYFLTYRESFNIGWFDAFQMAIHRDPHSSTDICHGAWIDHSERPEKPVVVKHDEEIQFPRTYEQTLAMAQRRMKLS